MGDGKGAVRANMKKTPHPGKTSAQRRVLDEIGCGNYSPSAARTTINALLEDGLIFRCGERVVGRGRFSARIPEFEMPVSIHWQWCQHQAEQFDMASQRGGLDPVAELEVLTDVR
ncbi:hypothetical protein [Komagataeibacter intermedius]|uniref:hypothetical protein n=1 Tax=Komagataeibacter intermedius TaxID=66229 RepID=UPI003B431C73